MSPINAEVPVPIRAILGLFHTEWCEKIVNHKANDMIQRAEPTGC